MENYLYNLEYITNGRVTADSGSLSEMYALDRTIQDLKTNKQTKSILKHWLKTVCLKYHFTKLVLLPKSLLCGNKRTSIWLVNT